MDKDPPGHTTPESDVGMLERMLGVLDWDSMQAPGARTASGHPDAAEQNPDTRSHLTGASVGVDRSQDRGEGHRNPRTSSARPKHGGDGPNSDKMQQMRARHREAQARYRAKHRVRPEEPHVTCLKHAIARYRAWRRCSFHIRTNGLVS
jgi:hypothetical protein